MAEVSMMERLKRIVRSRCVIGWDDNVTNADTVVRAILTELREPGAALIETADPNNAYDYGDFPAKFKLLIDAILEGKA